jgi:hypothetical protein
MKVQSNQSSSRSTQSAARLNNRLDDATRCWHRTPSGRRCKMPILRAGEQLCYQHTVEYKKADAFNLQSALLARNQAFQTAQGINFALQNLYVLLANNYISPRRASVLAYISSLLLRTLPAIDADRAAGIIDPTAPKEPQCSHECSAEVQDQEAPSQEPQTQQDQAPAVSAAPAPAHCEPTAEQADEENVGEHAQQTAQQPQPSAKSQPAACPTSARNPADSATKPRQTAERNADPAANRQQTTGRDDTAFPSKAQNTSNPRPPAPAWPKGIPEPDPTKKPS